MNIGISADVCSQKKEWGKMNKMTTAEKNQNNLWLKKKKKCLKWRK